jgi:hypothetical protein
VSCAVTTCMAVESFTIGDIDRPYVTGSLWNGKSWAPMPMPGPNEASGGGMSAVSCTAERWCMSVGSFTIGDVSSPVLAADRWDGKTWKLTPVPGP